MSYNNAKNIKKSKVYRICQYRGCKNSFDDKVQLFHFPKKQERQEKWLHLVGKIKIGILGSRN